MTCLLLDAGIELDTLYTADVTRTLPVDGRFSDDQREVYEAVLEAQQAGIDAARAGEKFADVHKAAIAVIARHLADWGLLPISAEESLAEEGGLHRRWMVHGTSHHLGIDVHDCAQARVENYREGTLQPGMIITVEPGLYFKSDDELVPRAFPRHRGADRGRRLDHRGRQRDPVGRTAAHQRRRRDLDGRAAEADEHLAAPPVPARAQEPRPATGGAAGRADAAAELGRSPGPGTSMVFATRARTWPAPPGTRGPVEGFVWLGLKDPDRC